MAKIALPEQTAFVIRGRRLRRTSYFMSHKMWVASPALATIFREFEAAEHEVWRARQVGLVHGDEILDVVPLYGALIGAR